MPGYMCLAPNRINCSRDDKYPYLSTITIGVHPFLMVMKKKVIFKKLTPFLMSILYICEIILHFL